MATTAERRERRPKSQVGRVLEAWRGHRRMSQLDLSVASGVTPRHVSFVETGRSTPSREILHTFAHTLDMPLRDRNDLFLAAGYAPPFRDQGRDDPEARAVAAAIDRILASHNPLPGVVMDRHWNLIDANDGARQLFGQLIDLTTIEPPANVLRLIFGPLRSAVDNWSELAPTLLTRAQREAVGGIPDPELQTLLDELATHIHRSPRPSRTLGPVIEVAFRINGSVQRYFSTITTLGTALDIDLQELRIELFHPCDSSTGTG